MDTIIGKSACFPLKQARGNLRFCFPTEGMASTNPNGKEASRRTRLKHGRVDSSGSPWNVCLLVKDTNCELKPSLHFKKEVGLHALIVSEGRR